VSARGRIVVIAVGNPFRRDDGVGHHIVAEAHDRLPPGVEIAAADGEPARLVERWAGADLAVVVDAVDGGGAPGTVHVLDGLVAALGGRDRPGSSHSLGVGDAVRLGRAVGRLPRALVCVGVTGAAWDHGEELSPAVAAAVPEAADRVVAIARALAPAGAG